MKRKQFLKTAAIGSAAALVGYPLINAQSAFNPNKGKFSYYNVISWQNSEIGSPYADSNLWLRQGGTDILNATQTSSGTIDPINGSQPIDVIQMGILGPWPAGYSGYLRITWNQYSGWFGQGTGSPYDSGILYENEVNLWKQGIIDSYTIDVNYYLQMDGVAEFKINCFTSQSGLL
jgi:hypothetical protein